MRYIGTFYDKALGTWIAIAGYEKITEVDGVKYYSYPQVSRRAETKETALEKLKKDYDIHS